MTAEHTERGFALISFEDLNGTPCTVQKSSLATDDAIWLGAKDIGLKHFIPYTGGWKDVPTRGPGVVGDYVANNRMHLTREQVAALLPILQRFVDTGEVSDA